MALSFALALTFSTTVCAAETVVPEKDFGELDTLAYCVEKSLPEYTSNAVADMDGVRDQAKIASGSNMFTEGKETNATCVVDKVNVAALRYAQQKAEQVGGTMLTVVELSAPGVNLVDAQVALRIEGVKFFISLNPPLFSQVWCISTQPCRYLYFIPNSKSYMDLLQIVMCKIFTVNLPLS